MLVSILFFFIHCKQNSFYILFGIMIAESSLIMIGKNTADMVFLNPALWPMYVRWSLEHNANQLTYSCLPELFISVLLICRIICMKREYRLTVKHITYSFKNEKILEDVNLDFSGGHIYGIIGKNGTGKSVLFKMICGFIHADEGEIEVNGKKIGKDIDFPESMGAIIEAPGFLPYQSGIKNLEYLAGIRKIATHDTIIKTMEMLGLDPFSKKRVGKYSLGMKQRLAIAQAIMENPMIIILDEPMNGLDEDGVVEMRRIFNNLKERGKLLILASHNKEDISILCDEVYEIKKGAVYLSNS